ncbi:MAG TPA: DUF4349 domain-containing protein [Candidatus Acidoferrales bacterium]|nr:DUF4349 domain-containing protein [Candidatus Acidoferrales bacterium]
MNHSLQHAFGAEEVMAYLDGELEPRRAAALASHLEGCEACGALAAQFRQLSERLLDFQIGPTPPGVGRAILDARESFGCETKTVAKRGQAEMQRRWRIGLTSPYTWVLGGTLAVLMVIGGVHQAMLPRYGHWLNQDVGYIESSSKSASKTELLPPPPNQKSSAAVAAGGGRGEGGAIEAPEPAGPMIAQTASLTIVATDYDEASTAIERLATAHGGYVQKLTVEARSGVSRSLSASLRVPASQLGGFLVDARRLGHVEEETRASDEVTDQYVDLQARLKSARATEQRLLTLLATRTGKLEDVLAAEQELARIREEIESMEGQRIVLAHRVDYATVELQLREEYRERLNSGSASTGTKLWNAAVEGLGNLEEGVIVILLFLLAYGLSILFWLTVVLVPAWLIWRRVRS